MSSSAAQFTSNGKESPAARVEIRLLHAVEQGGSGWFKIQIDSDEKGTIITLRLQRLAGTGAAVFANGLQQMSLEKTGEVEVQGQIASDLAGGLTLEAWSDGEFTPLAVSFFDVLAPLPSPRIFFAGRDVTDTNSLVGVGQQIALNVPEHPSLAIRNERWTIESGEYVGGFVHTLMHGGPQPIVLNGPTTTFYWVMPGRQRRVTYTLVLSDGRTANASTTFTVLGPSYTTLEVPPVEVMVGAGKEADISYLSFAGTGISFKAQYFLPEGFLPNYTWVQLVTRDLMVAKSAGTVDRCVPKSQPIPDAGSGLDTSYPYDSHNPTRDSPPVRLTPDSEEISRKFHARMYLLWGSGMSNSIVVPLGYVDWHFEGQAVRNDVLKNEWSLKKGNGGPDDSERPFRATHIYPLWNNLVPYTGYMRCE